MIDRVIFDELCHGIVSGSSKAAFLDVRKTFFYLIKNHMLPLHPLYTFAV